jgi:catechol 2,3-dioxygenase-like lactoylglutathione lyase family enzyme
MGHAVKQGTIPLGVVGHFGVAVRDPARSAEFWQKNFDLTEIFRYEGGIGLSNDNVTIVLSPGEPHPEVLGHMSFHLPSMKALRAALAVLKQNGVAIEDPDDEIGPEAPGSPNMGLWFHDPDGYRWELSVLNGANEPVG